MTQNARDFRQRLYEAASTLYADVRDTRDGPAAVYLGPPPNHQADIIIAIGLTTNEMVTRPTMGTNRSRERQVDIFCTISVYVPSSENDQQVAMDKCDELIDMLEEYVRTSPNERFEGACRDSWLSAIEGPTPGVITHPQSNQVTGRLAEAVVTVTGFCRY